MSRIKGFIQKLNNGKNDDNFNTAVRLTLYGVGLSDRL